MYLNFVTGYKIAHKDGTCVRIKACFDAQVLSVHQDPDHVGSNIVRSAYFYAFLRSGRAGKDYTRQEDDEYRQARKAELARLAYTARSVAGNVFIRGGEYYSVI